MEGWVNYIYVPSRMTVFCFNGLIEILIEGDRGPQYQYWAVQDEEYEMWSPVSLLFFFLFFYYGKFYCNQRKGLQPNQSPVSLRLTSCDVAWFHYFFFFWILTIMMLHECFISFIFFNDISLFVDPLDPEYLNFKYTL